MNEFLVFQKTIIALDKILFIKPLENEKQKYGIEIKLKNGHGFSYYCKNEKERDDAFLYLIKFFKMR